MLRTQVIIKSLFDSNEHQASFVRTADITIHEDVMSKSETAIRDTLRHEIGHFEGLHEQYLDNGTYLIGENGDPTTCNLYRDTVMNGPDTNGENCRGIHAPTAWDINAVDTYWLGEGRLDKPTLSKSGDNSVKVEWKDNIWADGWQLTTLFNWDWDSWSWIQLDSPLFNEEIGFHKDSINRTLVKEWDLQANDWPSRKWYLAKVQHWNWPTLRWSLQVYSNYIYVP